MNNFNLLAPVYDSLAGLVFGQTLYEAGVHFLAEIPAGSSVLVLGGGTGKLLSKLKKCEVVFVEKSSKMLNMAQERTEKEHVIFVNADFLEWQSDQQFDAVICPFFLDVFSEDRLRSALNKIHALLKLDGHLIIADFGKTNVWQHRLLLHVMHLFFWIFSSLESKKLKPIKEYIIAAGFQLEEERDWYKGLIFSIKATS